MVFGGQITATFIAVVFVPVFFVVFQRLGQARSGGSYPPEV